MVITGKRSRRMCATAAEIEMKKVLRDESAALTYSYTLKKWLTLCHSEFSEESVLLFRRHHVINHVDYAVGRIHIRHFKHAHIIVLVAHHQVLTAVITHVQLQA